MTGLLKDNAGYDLPALLIGSEGTLGVVTRVRWRLVARNDARALALIPLGALAERRAAAARAAPAAAVAGRLRVPHRRRALARCSSTCDVPAPVGARARPPTC